MNLLKQFIVSVRFIGLPDTLRVIQASLIRDWYERKYSPPEAEVVPVLPGGLQEGKQTSRGGRFLFQEAELAVRFLTEDMVQVSWSPGQPTPGYAREDTSWPEVEVSLRETGEASYQLSSPELSLTIQNQGTILYQDREGRQLRVEGPPRRTGEAWSQPVCLNPDEKLHGLGERAAPLDLRAAQTEGEDIVYELWNEDPGGHYSTGDDPLYVSIPLYISRKPEGNYLIFYENPYQGSVSMPPAGQEGSLEIEFGGGELQYYLTTGSVPHLLQRYTQLTGRPALPPRWALGYHQCRWGYKSEREIREVVAGFRKHDLPLSAVHLDIDYMDGYRVFTVHQERFPDLAGLSADLLEEGIRVVTIIDPGVKRDREYFLYREGLEGDYFCTTPDGNPIRARVWPGWCSFPDFTNPETRTWWKEQYPRLLDQGVSGIWHDMNEPAAFVGWGKPTLPTITRYDLEGEGGDHLRGNNLYGLMMNRAGYEALRAYNGDRRPWLLSRSGWAGTQRYAWNWTADVASSWQTFRQTLHTMLGNSLSGIPYTGSDIGGFGGHPSAELFTRWFQMAALTPFFRGHSATSTPRREPWVYGEPTTSIARKFLNLRYRLMPYLYTLAWEASQWGCPLMRPMFWDFEEDPRLGEVDDQYLLGDALLIAPVLEAGADARSVVFPPGDWYSLWDGARYQGAAVQKIPVSLEEIPVFVRGGSLLPMEQDGELQFHLYPPAGASDQVYHSRLYQDGGDGYGPGRLDEFRLTRTGREIELTWDREGAYDFPASEVTIILHGEEAFSRAFVNGQKIDIEDQKQTVPLFDALRLELE